MHPVRAGSPSDCEATACGLAGSRAWGQGRPPRGTPRSASRSSCSGRVRDAALAAGLREQSCRKPGRGGAPARATQSGGCARGARGPRTKAPGRARLAVRAAVPEPRDCPAFGWRGRGSGRCGGRRAPARNCRLSFPLSRSSPRPLTDLSGSPKIKRGGRGPDISGGSQPSPSLAWWLRWVWAAPLPPALGMGNHAPHSWPTSAFQHAGDRAWFRQRLRTQGSQGGKTSRASARATGSENSSLCQNFQKT